MRHVSSVDNNIKTWLSAPDPSISHNKLLDMRRKKPSSWLLQHYEFINWKTGDNSVFWIYGSPGSGKSVLCSSIVETLGVTSSLAYFYCTFTDEKTQNSRGLLSSLISQLAINSTERLAKLRSFHSSQSASGTPSVDRLFECLCQMLTVPGDIFIVIDALEECPTLPMPERAQILKHLECMVELGLSQLHILITSRPEVDIEPSMARMQARELDLKTVGAQAEDLRSYISSRLEQANWCSKLRELALETLNAKANGSFRWAACQLVSLEGCLPIQVKKILDNLPKDIEETYKHILKRILPHDRSVAARIFHMIAFAKRPLSVAELAEVFTVDWHRDPHPVLVEDCRAPDPAKHLLRICTNLIRITPGGSSSLVEFSHFTVHEYLISLTDKPDGKTDDRLEIYGLNAELAHTTLAQMCLVSICSAEYRAYVPKRCAAPFNEYATLYWTDHCRHGNVSTTISPLLLQIFDHHFDVWSAAFDSCQHALAWFSDTGKYQARHLPLLWAAYNGFLHIVKHLIAQRVDVNQESPYPTKSSVQERILRDAGLTALHLSSMGGHPEVADFLLKHDACIEARTKHGRTALQIASRWGQVDIVRLLLKHGANVNASSHNIDIESALDEALLKPRHLEVARVLIQCGADVNGRDVYGDLVLHRVSDTGDVDLARRVLDKNVDIEARTLLLYQTALHIACDSNSLRGPHLDMVRFLLKRGACIEARDDLARTPLNLASSSRGCITVVQILLEHGANIDSQDSGGNTALCNNAIAVGDPDVVHILPEHGANIHLQNKEGNTALHIAAGRSHLAVVHILLVHGADTEMRNLWYRNYETCTAQELASRLGHTRIVEALLQHKNSNYPVAQ
ncbi:ankyrin repeat-containing domain protein [Mycena pura]|uniref:Ankyrin repeat-containing domain protein n=1 Tax=Mycena pura TaxID=153505 RepID=A0AAD6Y4K9_9AGAR|nr:ankyrin repeat-containing domain protein [Mycena pura]